MQRWQITVLLLLSAFALFAAPAQEPVTLQGFSSNSSEKERDWESKLRSIPSPDNLRNYMQRLSARPHHVGSPYDKDNAEWILSRFKEWGWDAHIENFDVLFPTPKERLVEMLEPTHFKAKLEEPTVPGDPTSGQHDEQLPTYNAYSADGDVTAPLVYVNYGVPEDYEELDRLGISVKGAIIIARYGGSWRGIKPKVGAEHGAVGCLIYSDPSGDGYRGGRCLPARRLSPAGRRAARQRHGRHALYRRPADARRGSDQRRQAAAAQRRSDASPRFPPCLSPMPTRNPCSRRLGGRWRLPQWRGALPFPYHLGPGPTKVHLKVKANWDLKTLYDVIARIDGSDSPDEWVVRGNHHDAWVNGAEDPISGTVAELEEARAFGELLKQGWKPKRTIIYAVWDGEEPGLIGSTEWAEEHADELTQKAVAYLNSDSNGRGYFFAEGSHSLEKFINGVARDIDDPEKKISVWKRSQLRRIEEAATPEERQEARDRPDLRIGALGSGSDYGVFVDHLGIASLNVGYGGEDGGGIYHSVYDDFYWYTHFSDTTFVYGRALAQTAATAVMRLADAELLPFDFSNFADTMHRYGDELKKLLRTKQDEARELDREIEEGVFTATSDPQKDLRSSAP